MKIEGVDFVICPICKAKKRNLTKHMTMLHKLTKTEILTAYPNIQLICEDSSNLISKALEENWKDEEYARFHTYCATKEAGNPGGKSNKGKPKSESTKAKMKAFANSDLGKAIRSNNMKKTVERMNTDPKYTEIRRQNGRTQMLKNLENDHYGHKRYKHNGISYRSTWEVEVAKVLDALQIDYKYEATRFTWIDAEGIKRIYIPDFYLKDYGIYLEVKPECFVTEITDRKLQAVKQAGYEAVYVNSKDSIEVTKQICTLCRIKTP